MVGLNVVKRVKGPSVVVGVSIVDVLEDGQLMNASFELIYKRLLVDAVLVKALEAVQFDDIVVAEELLELLILVAEGAGLTEHTVLVVVEWPALRRSVLLFILLLNSFYVV